MEKVTRGTRIAEGKTKIIWSCVEAPALVIVESKDDITAGDGARHDLLTGKAQLANVTTCNVFEYLASQGMSAMAFKRRLDETKFLARRCDMIPLEVVVRAEAHGSYLKRHPGVDKGYPFSILVYELFLKTKGREWNGRLLPCDDPFMKPNHNGSAELYLPDQPIDQQEPFLILGEYPLCDHQEGFDVIRRVALHTFRLLEYAWGQLGCRLVDFKVEFGVGRQEQIMLADVIDNDSWRVVENEQYVDKEGYRQGDGLDETLRKYQRVAELTGKFGK